MSDTLVSGSDDMSVKFWRYVAPAESETWRSQDGDGGWRRWLVTVDVKKAVKNPMWTMWTEDFPKPLEICIIIGDDRDYIGIL